MLLLALTEWIATPGGCKTPGKSEVLSNRTPSFGDKISLIPSNLSQNESASVLNRVSHNKPRALADTGDSHALLLVEPHSPVLGTS